MLNVYLDAVIFTFVAFLAIHYIGDSLGYIEETYVTASQENTEGYDICMEQLSGDCYSQCFNEEQNTTGCFSKCYYESLNMTASLWGNSTAGSTNSFTVENNHNAIEATSLVMLLGHSAILWWLGLICSLTPLQMLVSISPNLIGCGVIAGVLRSHPETYVDGLVMAVMLCVITSLATFVLAYILQLYYFENEEGSRSFWLAVKYAKKRQAEGPFETKEKVTWQTRCKRSLMLAIPAFFVEFIIIFYSIAIFGLFQYRSGSAWYTFVAILAQVVKIGGNKLQIVLFKGETGWLNANNMYMVSLVLGVTEVIDDVVQGFAL